VPPQPRSGPLMSGGRLREPIRFLVFSASLRRDSWVEYLGERPDPALDRVD
jgi:hypothetical protein